MSETFQLVPLLSEELSERLPVSGFEREPTVTDLQTIVSDSFSNLETEVRQILQPKDEDTVSRREWELKMDSGVFHGSLYNKNGNTQMVLLIEPTHSNKRSVERIEGSPYREVT